ncbi:MAG: hypothetical protein WCT04_25680 [Planctomycetota bacterium]
MANQTGKRYSQEERASLLAIWDGAQGTNAVRFEAVQAAGYAGGLSGWLQNVRSWCGPKKAKASKAAKAPKAPKAPTAPKAAKAAKVAKTAAPGKLKRGRVGPAERALILEELKGGVSAAELGAKYSRSEKIVLSLTSGAKSGKASKAAAANQASHADPLAGIPEAFRGEFIAMILEKIENEHKHQVTHASKRDDAVRLYFQIKEISNQHDELVAKLKTL